MLIDRIVTINDSSNPKGGATMLAVEATAGFARAGYATTYLCGDSGINADLTALGVDVVGLGEQAARDVSARSTLVRALYNQKAERFVSAWIRANDTPRTVYHLHTWGQILSPSVLRSLTRVENRLVMSGHDFFHVCPNGSYSYLRTGTMCGKTPMTVGCITAQCDRKNYGYKLWRVARQAIRNHVFDTAAPVPMMAIHERMRSLFIQGGMADKWVRTLPNPIHPFTTSRIPAEDNDELVFIGRLETTKGPDLAAAAARAAGVKMRFIGAGVLAESLQRAYPDMLFDGFTSRDRIPALLGKARALIMPSRYAEPYGLVAVEAMWSGLPVIIADAAFLAPDVIKAGAGLACRSTDERGLVNAIKTIFDDDALTRRMSLAAYEGTRDLGHTPDVWLEKLLEMFRERLHEAARPTGIKEAARA